MSQSPAVPAILSYIYSNSPSKQVNGLRDLLEMIEGWTIEGGGPAYIDHVAALHSSCTAGRCTSSWSPLLAHGTTAAWRQLLLPGAS